MALSADVNDLIAILRMVKHTNSHTNEVNGKDDCYVIPPFLQWDKVGYYHIDNHL